MVISHVSIYYQANFKWNLKKKKKKKFLRSLEVAFFEKGLMRRMGDGNTFAK